MEGPNEGMGVTRDVAGSSSRRKHAYTQTRTSTIRPDFARVLFDAASNILPACRAARAPDSTVPWMRYTTVVSALESVHSADWSACPAS